MTTPEALALVTELEQHMRVLLLNPAPVAKAPAYFLDYWAQHLHRIRELLARNQGAPAPTKGDDLWPGPAEEYSRAIIWDM